MEEKYREALEKILAYEKNPIRRVQYAGCGDYAAPDWIQTKKKIFEIAKEVLKEDGNTNQ